VGSVIAAIGRSAALTAPAALAIPAPQFLVLQMHSCVVASVCGHRGGCVDSPAEVVGKAVAPSFKRDISWHELKFRFTEDINAAMPDTIGAEKLVPRFGSFT